MSSDDAPARIQPKWGLGLLIALPIAVILAMQNVMLGVGHGAAMSAGFAVALGARAGKKTDGADAGDDGVE